MAQTVRFDTNVGTFDLELNPTGNANLQGHVDNMLAYVDSGRYDLTVINRAVDGFVLQMGGFELANSLTLPSRFSDFPAVATDAAVVVDADNDGQVDFDVSGLLNTRSTVSLALSTGPNTGTSSFFVNLASNPSLDSDDLRFIPFANVLNMATIDLIVGLPQANYQDGSLAGDNVPTLRGDHTVFVERAFVLDPPEAVVALAVVAEGESLTALEAASGGATAYPSASSGSAPALHAHAVPEPPALVLAVGAMVLAYALKPHRIR
jgi:peptidyl-prolyl cis-trans isomerase A (cyclophilin A)